MSNGKSTGVINIHGKEYSTVALRVQRFREKYPDWTLATEIVDRSEDAVVFRAAISDEAGRLRATGHSEEYRKASQINRTSALENAETSAIGRALATLGLGGTEFASADEVANAIHQQGEEEYSALLDGAKTYEEFVDLWRTIPRDKRPACQAAIQRGKKRFMSDHQDGTVNALVDSLPALSRQPLDLARTAQDRSSGGS